MAAKRDFNISHVRLVTSPQPAVFYKGRAQKSSMLMMAENLERGL